MRGAGPATKFNKLTLIVPRLAVCQPLGPLEVAGVLDLMFLFSNFFHWARVKRHYIKVDLLPRTFLNKIFFITGVSLIICALLQYRRERWGIPLHLPLSLGRLAVGVLLSGASHILLCG